MGSSEMGSLFGDNMVPAAYFNFENFSSDGGGNYTQDLISGGKFRSVNPFGQSSSEYSFSSLRGDSAQLSLTNGISYSGQFPNIDNSGSFSFRFWHVGEYGLLSNKTGWTTLQKSGTDFIYAATIDHSGNLNFSVRNQSGGQGNINRSGVDITRWNMIYCEHDYGRNTIGVSVNAEPLSYSPFSGLVNSSGNLSIYHNTGMNGGDNAFIDELGFWSGTLSSDSLSDHYSNGLALSYSGNNRYQFMYPRSTKDSNSSWYDDELWITPAPYARLWEYVNEGIAGSYYYDNGIHSNLTDDKYVHFNFGKCHIKPSSIIAYTTAAPRINPIDSGYLKSVYVYDNNDNIVASGQGEKVFSVNNGFYENSTGLQLTVIEPNPDLQNISAKFTFAKYNEPSYFSIHNCYLYMSGTNVAETGLNLIGSGGIDRNSHIDLYTQAYSSGTRTLDLYMAGHLPTNSGIPLYVYGHQPLNSGLNLYTYGWDTRNSGLDLSIQGAITLNSGVNLYTYGSNIHNGSLNLFTKYEPIEKSGGLGLFTFAANDPTVQRGLDLYLKTALASSQVGTLNMYVAAPDSAESYGTMPLYLENNTLTYGHVELFLKNAYQSGFKGLKLYTRGEGTLDGGLPYNGSMPLFIERTEGAERGLSMFMQVNDGTSKGLNLNTVGGTYATSGLDLTIPSTYSLGSGILELLVRGY